MQENQGCFSDARWALFWSADVLRRRYLPKIGAFWREIDAEGTRELETLQTGVPGRVERAPEKMLLPEDEDDRHALALKVEDVLRGMGPPHGLLLRQLAWGDAWCDAALRAAMAHREKARREGLRLRVNYRYTYRQLASLHDCEAKAVWRRVRAAMAAFAAGLHRAGLLWLPENAAAPVAGPAAKRLQAHEFMGK